MSVAATLVWVFTVLVIGPRPGPPTQSQAAVQGLERRGVPGEWQLLANAAHLPGCLLPSASPMIHHLPPYLTRAPAMAIICRPPATAQACRSRSRSISCPGKANYQTAPTAAAPLPSLAVARSPPRPRPMPTVTRCCLFRRVLVFLPAGLNLENALNLQAARRDQAHGGPRAGDPQQCNPPQHHPAVRCV